MNYFEVFFFWLRDLQNPPISVRYLGQKIPGKPMVTSSSIVSPEILDGLLRVAIFGQEETNAISPRRICHGWFVDEKFMYLV